MTTIENDSDPSALNAIDTDLFGYDRTTAAVEILRQFEPPEGYYLAFSGGKDSVALKALADLARVKYDAHFSLTTLDPPELVRFVRDHFPDVEISKPPRSFFQLLPKYGFPRRQTRWCCQVFKERGFGRNRITLTGVRRAESIRRRRRQLVEVCATESKRFIHPILHWSDADVWDFTTNHRLPVCRLYAEGYTRIGCIACPMQTPAQRKRDLARWPKYERALRHAFSRLYDRRKLEKNPSVARWRNSDEMFDWWIKTIRSSAVPATQTRIDFE